MQTNPLAPEQASLDARWMRRCLQLAQMGAPYVAPNPMVGAVLVARDPPGRLLAEAYHAAFGGSHAEAALLDRFTDAEALRNARLYVSLEPCSHHGKTPPCAERIVAAGIPEVVVAAQDPNPRVAGRGIEWLRQAGVSVRVGILEEEARRLNAAFFHHQQTGLPYVVLKWAASADGFLAPAQGGPKRISGPMSDRLVHRLRAGCRGILVGTETARLDDPLLTNRHWPGRHPLRFVLDRRLRLPHHLRLFASGDAQTYVITEAPPEAPHPARLLAVDDLREVGALLRAVAGQGVDALLVEGGARLLEAFLAADAWQAVFRIQSTRVFLGAGPAEPPLPREAPQAVWQLQDDRIAYWLC